MEQIHRQIEAEIPRLRRYARFLARDRDQADDLVQECLVKAIAKLDTYQPGTNLPAWLFTILRHCRVDAFRRRRKAQLVELGDDLPELAVSAGCEERIQLRELWAAFGSLPGAQSEVLELVAVEGLRYEEAAEILGVPVGTVRSRLSRGRATLRLWLAGSTPKRSPPGRAQAGFALTARPCAPSRAQPRHGQSQAPGRRSGRVTRGGGCTGRARWSGRRPWDRLWSDLDRQIEPVVVAGDDGPVRSGTLRSAGQSAAAPGEQGSHQAGFAEDEGGQDLSVDVGGVQRAARAHVEHCGRGVGAELQAGEALELLARHLPRTGRSGGCRAPSPRPRQVDRGDAMSAKVIATPVPIALVTMTALVLDVSFGMPPLTSRRSAHRLRRCRRRRGLAALACLPPEPGFAVDRARDREGAFVLRGLVAVPVDHDCHDRGDRLRRGGVRSSSAWA